MPESKVPTLDKYHEIELQHLFEAMLSTRNLRVQAGIFFGTVNLGALGIAFSRQNAGIVLLASVLITGFLFIEYISKRQLLSIYYRTAQLRKQFAPQDSKSFFPQAGWVKLIDREVVSLIENPINQENIIHDLDHLFLKHVFTASLGTILMPIAFGIAQILLGLYLWLGSGWPLF